VGEERSERPRDGRADHQREADRARGALDAGDHDQREPGEADEDAQLRRQRDPLSREGAQEDHLQWHRADDHRRRARVDPRLGERDDADAEPQQRKAEQRRGRELPARDPDAPPAQDQDQRKQCAREQEAQACREKRGEGAHGDLDRDVGRAPDAVPGPEGGQELPAGGHLSRTQRPRRV
jgi:hypothetical protein